MNSAAPPKIAVILAAGMGSRLGDRGRERPKGFLHLGDQSIIEESLERLRDARMERVIIVTGHCSDWYEELAASNAGFVTTVHNPIYANSGSMYSLFCAREHIEEDFLLLESDIIYERRALAELMEFEKDNGVLLSGKTNSGDEVFVELADDRLVNMSKSSEQLQSIAGELVGITKVSVPLFEHMLEIAEAEFVRNQHKLCYETDCLVEAAKHYPVFCHLVDELIWAEIDDEQHLNRAKSEIYPALLSRDCARI